jgi:hypothetical protein
MNKALVPSNLNMADVTFSKSAGILDAYGLKIPVANNVRLNKDGTGPRSSPDQIPYMPQGFPLGQWKITGVFPRTVTDLAPFFISTNAWQMVPEWTVDLRGKFISSTGRWVHDAAYGIHFSILDFTWGCIRVINRSDLEWLATKIQDELDELRKLNPAQAWVSMEAVA